MHNNWSQAKSGLVDHYGGVPEKLLLLSALERSNLVMIRKSLLSVRQF
jgi:hypothetical protein